MVGEPSHVKQPSLNHVRKIGLMNLLVRCHRDPCKPELHGPARPDQPGGGGGPVAGQAGQYGRGPALVVQWKG
jgi:hypothetical protein